MNIDAKEIELIVQKVLENIDVNPEYSESRQWRGRCV